MRKNFTKVLLFLIFCREIVCQNISIRFSIRRNKICNLNVVEKKRFRRFEYHIFEIKNTTRVNIRPQIVTDVCCMFLEINSHLMSVAGEMMKCNLRIYLNGAYVIYM